MIKVYRLIFQLNDKESVVKTICEWVRDDVEEEIFEIIEGLPQDILDDIKISRKNINVDTSDVDNFIESYLELSEPKYNHHESDYDYGGISELSILDCIFK